MTLSRRLFGIVVSIAMAVSLQIPGLAFAEGDSAGSAAQPAGDAGSATIQLQAVTPNGIGDMSLAAWDGTTSTEWTNGSGTAEDPYLIESAENLAYLRDQVNAGTKYTDTYFKQTVDIDLNDSSWIPIGTYESYSKTYPFGGHYDGGGNVISGLNVNRANYAGLFGYVIGTSASPATLSGIVVEGKVAGTGTGTSNYVGAISAYCQYATITNCGNNASVTSAGQCVGGVVGNLLTSDVDGCYNHGSVISAYETTSAGGFAGGIVSRLTSNVVNITNCYNTGTITSTYDAGGIAGNATQSTTNVRTVQNCFNAGNIVGETSSATRECRLGGIIGGYDGSNSNYKAKTVLSNCWSLLGSPAKSVIGWPDSYETYTTVNDCGAKNAEGMKSAAFVASLGDKYIAGSSYPALYWEAPDGIPEITGQPESAAYVKDVTATALSVVARGDAANGDLAYQWYKAASEDLSDEAAISGATGAAYVPPTDTIGDFYYYCAVNNNVKALDGSGPFLVKSDVAHVQVWSGASAVAPAITSQPADISSVGQGSTSGNELSVAAEFAGADETADNCALSYQWQKADSAEGDFADVEGATEASYAAPTSEIGTTYYRVIVTNTRERQSSASATSNVVSVTVAGYTIDSYDKLKEFAAAVDAGDDFSGRTVTLAADIDVASDYNPAGDYSTNTYTNPPHYFAGEFDGAGHTVTFNNVNTSIQYFGIVAAAGAGASFHDIVVKGSIASSSTSVAGVVGYAGGAVSFERVGNEASISSTGAASGSNPSNAGGILGNAPLTTPVITFTDCYNKGDITGSGRGIGGLVGQAKASISSCYNTGSISSTGSYSSNAYPDCVGGLHGGGSAPTVKNSYSTGTVSTPNAASGNVKSGALSGYASTMTGPSENDVCFYLDTSNPRGRAGANQLAGFISKTEAEFKDESSDAGVLKLLANDAYAEKWVAGSALDPAQSSPTLYWEVPEPVKYKVTFVDEDGAKELKAPAEYVEGTKAADVERPDNPTKTVDPDDGYSYAFSDWVNAATGENGVADVAADATYKASYAKTAKEYDITYDLDGGEQSDPANPSTYTVETDDFTLLAPSKEGHSFEGWTGTDLGEAVPEVTIAKGSLGNRSYTATWKKNSYDVTFDSDGGSAVDAQTVEHGGTASKPADPTKDGFDFVEWQKDGSTFDFATAITGATELKAVWKEKEQSPSEAPASQPSADAGSSTPPKSDTAEPAQSTASATAAPAKVSTVAPALKASKVANTSIKLVWGKVAGASKYVLYGNKCSTKNKIKKIATVNGTSYRVVKAAGKKLKKGTYYKFQVYAYDSNGKVIGKTLLTHVATTGGKYCNAKKVTTKAKKSNVSLKAGKSFKLGAKQVREKSSLKLSNHVGLRYATSNKTIATVSKAGTIKARKAGTCYVYAVAQNGVYAKVKVTVK